MEEYLAVKMVVEEQCIGIDKSKEHSDMDQVRALYKPLKCGHILLLESTHSRKLGNVHR